jgi:hypothetical protein
LYGAAEFSRDLDLLVLTDPDSIARIRSALEELQAKPIAVPDFEPGLMDRGHAIHFRCSRPDVEDLRIDIMSKMRGVDDFETLWARRTKLEIDGDLIDVISEPDLVQAKKTQRRKDWPMIQRVVEVSYFSRKHSKDSALLGFWLREMRTPELLIRLAADNPEEALTFSVHRPAVAAAIQGDFGKVLDAMLLEEREEGEKDRAYWEPLKRELEEFRRERRR